MHGRGPSTRAGPGCFLALHIPLTNNVLSIAMLSKFDDPARLPETFELMNRPKEQYLPLECEEGCLCTTGDCACFKNQTTCRPTCPCNPYCWRRFPFCKCQDECDDSCYCQRFRRECTIRCRKGACYTRKCYYVFKDRRGPRTKIKESTIPGAGEGLFAAEHIKKNAFIGQYKGKIVDHTVFESKEPGIRLFEVAWGQSIC